MAHLIYERFREVEDIMKIHFACQQRLQGSRCNCLTLYLVFNDTLYGCLFSRSNIGVDGARLQMLQLYLLILFIPILLIYEVARGYIGLLTINCNSNINRILPVTVGLMGVQNKLNGLLHMVVVTTTILIQFGVF